MAVAGPGASRLIRDRTVLFFSPVASRPDKPPANSIAQTIGKDFCANFIPVVVGATGPERAAYRCEQSSDCPGTLSCVKNLWVHCNRCEPATWKLKTTGDGDRVTGLFDLSTNPGEEERLNAAYNQCDGKAKPPQEQAPLMAVIDELRVGDPQTAETGVADWLSCVTNAACTTAY